MDTEKNLTEETNNAKPRRKNIEEKFCDWLQRWPKIGALYLKYEEILVYLVVGVLTTIVAWGTKFLVNFIFFGNTMYPNVVQNLILSTANWVAGVTFAYFTNRAYVFKSHGPMLEEIPKFVGSRLFTLVLDLIVMQILSVGLHINQIVATLLSSILVMIVNYIASKLLVFRNKEEDSKEDDSKEA